MSTKTGHYSVRDWLETAKDEDGDDPTLCIAASESRGPGKTFSTTDLGIEKNESGLGHLGWLTRYHKSLPASVTQINKVLSVTREGSWCTMKEIASTVGELTIHTAVFDEDGERLDSDSRVLGYAIPLNLSGQVKELSGLFTNMPQFIFDEFQPKDPTDYLRYEVWGPSGTLEDSDFMTVLESCNRGTDQAINPFKVFMLSNTESIANPYYVAYGLVNRIRSDSKRVRGSGWVYEKARSVMVEEQRINSPLGKLLKRNTDTYNNGYKDNKTGITKPAPEWGDSEYIGTIVINGRSIGMRYYGKKDILYVSRSHDATHPVVYRVDKDDDVTMASLRGSMGGTLLRQCGRDGSARFDSVATKAAILPILY